ncbi:AAA family ATPase [Paenibacillus fonticola]|uniref:AAA family ATPase n=1 Tax=Paenibacillus fonticola TaxID=379896 RepID=UPI00037ECFAF|nr:AAA family ATPase [Paenibacillus fonticola]
MSGLSKMDAYLRSIALRREEVPSFREYPFHLPAVADLERLEFHPRVTYIVGENGMGKSTLLEAIAVALGFNPEGGTLNFNFSTAETHSELHEYIRLVRGVRKPRDGFFFRAESYYNLATEIGRLDEEGGGPSVVDSYGGKPLHMMSHGESFFAAFMNRFRGRGLYIMDEPEAALSPYRQMAMLSRIHQLVSEYSQLIISTHSPIIMAYPDSVIYQLTPEGIREATLEETDHFVIMKEFMNGRERMLKELLE